MKNVLLTAILCILSMLAIAQVPEGFNYQAVLRNSSGELISDQSVDVEISIRDIQSDGAILFTETHDKTTNEFGLVNLIIGTGTVT